MVVISPSILSADFAELGDQIGILESVPGADYIHFDVMDGMFVPNISFGIPVLKCVRRITKRVLDVHLMIEDPIRYIDAFADAGADIITFHIEAAADPQAVIDKIHSRNLKAGVSVKPGTDIQSLRPFFGKADMFLIMTVEPGFGGQSYIDYCTDKIIKLRNELKAANLETDIEVDGGIGKSNIETVLDAGANVLVMGSSIFKDDIAKNVTYYHDICCKYE